MFVQGRIF